MKSVVDELGSSSQQSAGVHRPSITGKVQATAGQRTFSQASSNERRLLRTSIPSHSSVPYHEPTMPPKVVKGSIVRSRQPQRGNIAKETYNVITDPENRSVVTALAFFVGGVAFLHSSWSEILLPPAGFGIMEQERLQTGARLRHERRNAQVCGKGHPETQYHTGFPDKENIVMQYLRPRTSKKHIHSQLQQNVPLQQWPAHLHLRCSEQPEFSQSFMVEAI
ncbi:hypothetical protein AC578_7805, partial [Pseudocercospora eumusae]